MELEYGLNSLGNIDILPLFTKDMEMGLPESRILELSESGCWGGWSFSENMILGDYIAPGTEIEVSDDEENWKPCYFACYIPFSKWKIQGFDRDKNPMTYQYCRLIEEKQEPTKPEQTKQEVFDKNGNVIGYFIPKGGE